MERSYELGKELVAAIEEKRVYPEQREVHERHRSSLGPAIRANKEKWAHDYLYWVQKDRYELLKYG